MHRSGRRFGRNYVKTAMLMAFLIAMLAIGGQMIGGTGGMLLFGGIGLVFNFVSYWFSDRIALMAHRAQPVTREQLPEVYEIVERLTRKAGLPMPRIYVIPSDDAQRLRHRPQPGARRGGGDRGHPAHPRPAPARGRAGPRARPREEPRHPHRHDRRRRSRASSPRSAT